MKVAIATIRLKSTSEGGKTVPVQPGADFGCPVFFKDVPQLSEHGYDCRLLLRRIGIGLAPGETRCDVPVGFLSPEEVFPNLKIGVRFELWEGRVIGEGEVTGIVEE